jgi:hypothetical protein
MKRVVDPRRWAIGQMGSARIGLFKRASDSADIGRQLGVAIDALRAMAPVGSMGTVAVEGQTVGLVDAPMLFQLAERELDRCGVSGRREAVRLSPAP